MRSFFVLFTVLAILSSTGLASSYFVDSAVDSSNHNGHHQFLAYAASSSADDANKFSKTKSGLVVHDPLTNDSSINTDFWTIGGEAADMNAVHSASEDPSGLHIAVKAISDGKWIGLFAVSPNSPAHLYHSVLSVPFKTVDDHWWDTGMYIQTSDPKINYVTCSAAVDTDHVTWAVVSTKGNADAATQFHTLWTDNSPNQPYTRDCTIITNGSNLLQVYLDNKLVYSNNTLDLQMPSPFNAYLEVQSSTASRELSSTYADFYSTTSQFVKIIGAPAGGKIQLVNSSTGKVLADSSVGSDGSVSLDIAKYHMPIGASIKAFDASGNQIANSTDLSIWGGDEYKMVSSSTGSAATRSNNDNNGGSTSSANDNNNNNNNGDNGSNKGTAKNNANDNNNGKGQDKSHENDIQSIINNIINSTFSKGPDSGTKSSTADTITLDLDT